MKSEVGALISAGVLNALTRAPLKQVARAVLSRWRAPASVRQAWDACRYPHYLFGAVRAAQFARDQRQGGVTIAEMGCAGGRGLLELAAYADAASRETGVRVSVFGFDIATGLPPLCGDHRDHPDAWQAGDFPMDIGALEARLPANTRLVLGNVRDTVPEFISTQLRDPLGFLAFDLDLYSSTRDALRILDVPPEGMLKRVALYFDDVNRYWSNSRSGEQLAIAEFNRDHAHVVIDPWTSARYGRPFRDAEWLDRMYLAHNLRRIEALAHSGPVNLVHSLPVARVGASRSRP